MLSSTRALALLVGTAYVLGSAWNARLYAQAPEVIGLRDSVARLRCIEVTGAMLNSGASLALSKHLELHVPGGHQHLTTGSWQPYERVQKDATERLFSQSQYCFCIDNRLPISTSWVLLAEGFQVQDFRVWAEPMGSHTAGDSSAQPTKPSTKPLTVGGLPVGLGQTAVKIDVPAGARYEVHVEYRGAVVLSLTTQRQYYVAAYERTVLERGMLLAYLSASGMLLLIVLGISLVIYSRTYFYLSAYCIAFTAWALLYSGYMTHAFAEGWLLNDQMLPTLLSLITFMLALWVTRTLLQPFEFSALSVARYRFALRVQYVLVALLALMLLAAQLDDVLPEPVRILVRGLYALRDWATIAGFSISLWSAVPATLSASRGGYLPARWLIVSYGLTAAISVPAILYFLGFVSERNVATASVLAGALVQFFFFSLAIGARFRVSQQRKIESLAASQRQLAQQNETLETKVMERTAEIEAMADQLMVQNQVLQVRNEEMVSSLEYAERIQRALLPTEGHLHRAFREHFVLYQPRDIVSGDFFWSHESEETVVVAVADCTGHGVPGAFLSMISADLLRQIIVERNVSNPAEALLLLDIGVRNVLRQDESDVLDGLDISLCFFHRNTNELVFAGANHSLYLATGRGMVREVRGTRRTIGEKRRKGQITHAFQSVMLDYADFDTLYLLTDGYCDQFGSQPQVTDKYRKYGRRRLIELLGQIQDQPLSEQRERLLQAHMSWKGARKQVDDLLVVGMRTR